MYIFAIVGFIALMAALFADRLEHQRNPNRRIEQMTAPDGAQRIVLQRNRSGHYLASGTVDGAAAELIVDTGATDVAVSGAVATAAGLERGAPVSVMTANGITTAYATRIGELRLGGIVEHEVPATIVPAMDGIEVLLGMSFLARLDFSQQGDTLILTSRRAAAVSAP
jgi:aspartyl protease family protein